MYRVFNASAYKTSRKGLRDFGNKWKSPRWETKWMWLEKKRCWLDRVSYLHMYTRWQQTHVVVYVKIVLKKGRDGQIDTTLLTNLCCFDNKFIDRISTKCKLGSRRSQKCDFFFFFLVLAILPFFCSCTLKWSWSQYLSLLTQKFGYCLDVFLCIDALSIPYFTHFQVFFSQGSLA